MPTKPDADRIAALDEPASEAVSAPAPDDVIRSLREATIVAEQRLGQALGRIKELETEIARSKRNTMLFHHKVVRPLYRYVRWVPGVRRLAAAVKR